MALPLINAAYLEKLREYFVSGDIVFDFENASEADKGEILDFLETLMDLAEAADATATRPFRLTAPAVAAPQRRRSRRPSSDSE